MKLFTVIGTRPQDALVRDGVEKITKTINKITKTINKNDRMVDQWRACLYGTDSSVIKVLEFLE